MKSSSLEEENIIKDVGGFFRLEKEIDDNVINDIRNFLGYKKKTKYLEIEDLEILAIFLSMKEKKKIIINQ